MKRLTSLFFFLSVLSAPNAPIAAPTIYPKIIGGTPADTSAWPWMAALVVKNTNTSVFCGGTLIAPSWVLTAAHCMFDEVPANTGHYVPTSISEFDVLLNRPLLRTATGERITPAQIIVHPEFDHITMIDDVALIKLSSPSSVQPVETLFDFSPLDQGGQDSIALGWGTTSAIKNALPNALQQVNLPIVTNAQCSLSLDGIEDSMLCAGSLLGGIDTCSGDSGGPLLVYENGRGMYRQAGITSFGEADCAAPGYYGVYTRLQSFKAFISSTICTLDQIPPTPTLKITTSGTTATAKWTLSPIATGYRLNYAPYPSMTPISSAELNTSGTLVVNLPANSAFYVAVDSYNHNCRSSFSNIESFVLH